MVLVYHLQYSLERLTVWRIKIGDTLIGIPSSGLHTNGYSLARKIFFEIGGYEVEDKIPDLQRSVGMTLLEPHINYTNHVLSVLKNGTRVNGIAHITGGGLIGIPPISALVFPQGKSTGGGGNSVRIEPDFEIVEIARSERPADHGGNRGFR